MSDTEITVEITVTVTIDESKFTDQFMREFRESFYPFITIQEHKEHLAQMYARGLINNHSFIEGYGPAKDMGISFDKESVEIGTI